MSERVGILGLGRMGAAIFERLNDQGCVVTGWNRTPRDLGGTSKNAIFSEIGDVVAQADIILLSLFDDQAVQDVIKSLCVHDLSGKIVVDTSTTRPETLRALESTVNAAGAQAVDAPIAGGPDLVLAGKVGLYVGGDKAAVARFRPIGDAFAARLLHVGDLGAGATAKIFNNMMLCGLWQTLKEAMLTGRAGGLSIEQMVDIMAGSPAASPAFTGRIPILLGESDVVGFSVNGVVKDAELFADVAAQLGVETPSLDAGLQSFKNAAIQGYGDADLVTMVSAAVNSGD